MHKSLRADAAALSEFNWCSANHLTINCACAVLDVRLKAVLIAVARDGHVVRHGRVHSRRSGVESGKKARRVGR